MSGYPRWMSEPMRAEHSYKALWAELHSSQGSETLSSRNRVLGDSVNGENALTTIAASDPGAVPARLPRERGLLATPERQTSGGLWLRAWCASGRAALAALAGGVGESSTRQAEQRLS